MSVQFGNTGPLAVDPDSPATPDNSEPGEFRCPECNCRCTRGPSGTEYGHADRGSRDGNKRCKNRDPAVDSSRYGVRDEDTSLARKPNGQFASGRENTGAHAPRDETGRFVSAGGAS